MTGFNLRSGLRAMVTLSAEGVHLDFAKISGQKIEGVTFLLHPDEAKRLVRDIEESLRRGGHAVE